MEEIPECQTDYSPRRQRLFLTTSFLLWYAFSYWARVRTLASHTHRWANKNSLFRELPYKQIDDFKVWIVQTHIGNWISCTFLAESWHIITEGCTCRCSMVVHCGPIPRISYVRGLLFRFLKVRKHMVTIEENFFYADDEIALQQYVNHVCNFQYMARRNKFRDALKQPGSAIFVGHICDWTLQPLRMHLKN